MATNSEANFREGSAEGTNHRRNQLEDLEQWQNGPYLDCSDN